MGKTWLLKWDYKRYNFKDIDNEYKSEKKGLGINYGTRVDNNNSNIKKLKKNRYTDIKPDDEIFIYFSGIPGGSNQIFIKASKLQFEDEFGNNYIWEYEDNTIQRYLVASTIEWVLDYNDILRFTKDGLEKEHFSIQERPHLLPIEDENLIDVLNNNIRTYSELSETMRKKGRCVFEVLEYGKKTNHELFVRENNLPYLEQHHFITQEIYRDYKNDNNEDKLKKIIYSTDNILLLCPRCHRMIHQSNKEQRKEMIELIKNDKNYQQLFNNIKLVENIINEKDLISRMYDI